MNIRVGTVESVQDRFLTAKLYHTGQIIDHVVKGSPLNLDEREQKPNIKVGTEVMMLEDDYGVVYAICSLSQGIDIIKSGVSRLENNEVQIYGNEIIKIMGASGDNSGTSEKSANQVDIWSKKVNIRNDSTNLIQLIADLAKTVADTTPTFGSSKDAPNKEKSNALSIKDKIEAYL